MGRDLEINSVAQPSHLLAPPQQDAVENQEGKSKKNSWVEMKTIK